LVDAELLNRTVRERIRNLRSAEPETKLSQAELGKILGLSRSAVANLESGAQRVSLHNIYAICAHFNLKLEDLLPSFEDVCARTESTKPFKYDVDPQHVAAFEKLQKG